MEIDKINKELNTGIFNKVLIEMGFPKNWEERI